MKTKTDTFLLEIGTEEIPADYIKPALSQLKTSVDSFLKQKDIFNDEIQIFATSKRLVLYIKRLSIEKPANIEVIMGPPARVGFDENNKPTKAAIGFSKKFNLKVKNLKITTTDKGKYICAEKKIPAKSITKVFVEEIPGIVKNLHFPKRMKWDNSKLTFARPVRWICCLLGNEIVNIDIGNISSDEFTYIDENGEHTKIKVSNPDEYFKKIKKNNVFLNHENRKKFLKSNIDKISSKYNASSLDFQKRLLDEVNFLVEKPYIFAVKFKENYLNLPKEVLLASMSKHQRIFGIGDNKTEKLIPRFIAVVDGEPDDLDSVKRNYRKVLESRLQDSLFFFNQDTQAKLKDKIDNLKEVVYHKKLGTIYDKVERIFELSKYVANETSLPVNELKFLEKAVWLSKADLTTSMVAEFPSLQGTVGKIYAEIDGEDKKISNAIYEHYLPRFSDDCLPEGDIGSIISIADRLDSIVGYFGIDVIPTGSYDPYGLRRDIYAIIKTVISHNFNLNLDDVILKSVNLYTRKFQKSEDKIVAEIKTFVKDRLKILFSSVCDDNQIIDAVLATDLNDIFETYRKLKELNEINSEDYFLKAAKVAERTKRIYKNTDDNIPETVNPDLFKESLEKQLWEAYIDNEKKINEFVESKKYKKAAKIYGDTFYNLIHDFFDKVMVNVDNEDLRCNRLAICKNIYEIYNLNVADLSAIKITEDFDVS